MEKRGEKPMKEMNAHRVSITMSNGVVFRGFINIGANGRLSDFFRKPESGPFVVVFEASANQGEQGKVYFLNWDHILWVEPYETEDRTKGSGEIVLEGNLK
jgi:hypothetical protein